MYAPVMPVCRMLGIKRVSHVSTLSGARNVARKQIVAELPLVAAINQILAFPEVRQDLARARPLGDGMIRDISDGWGWQGHKLMNNGGPMPLFLDICCDAKEYCDGLGYFRPHTWSLQLHEHCALQG